MSQKFEKNFIEKFGDFYSKMGRRALFSLGCIGFGVLLEFVLAGVGLGAIIAILSVYNLISICEKEKTRYLRTVQVVLPNGNKTSCALFEQENYFKNNTFEQFLKFLKNNYPKYEVDRYVEDDKELQSLFSH